MQKLPPCHTETDPSISFNPHVISVSRFEHSAQDWLYEVKYSQNTTRTLVEKFNISHKLFWFLRERSYAECGVPSVRDRFSLG
jgi:hypothetical protein